MALDHTGAPIVLNRARLDVNGHTEKPDSGIGVAAEIKTGRRCFIGYLLSPQRRYAPEVVRER